MSLCLEFVFIALLLWASYVDWKTLTIPDFVPQAGVLLALLVSITAPEILFLSDAGTNQYLNFKKCLPQQVNEQSPLVLALCLLAISLWILSELYIFPVLRPRRGVIIALQICLKRLRRTLSNTKTIAMTSGSLCFGIAAVLLVHHWGGKAWLGLSTALLGSLFGMLCVWAIRIMSGLSFRQEALGYGDVVFVAMIGSWLGWQPTFGLLVIAPLVALLLVMTAQKLFHCSQFAYGPALAISALIIRYNWARFESRFLNYIQMAVDLSYLTLAVLLGGAIAVCGSLVAVRLVKAYLRRRSLRLSDRQISEKVLESVQSEEGTFSQEARDA